MALFTWGDKFSVGIVSIDDQHKELVKYLNDLHDGMLGGKGSDVTGPILDGLVAYTVKHFAYEEKIFADQAYPDAAAHKKEHENLVAQVSDFVGKFKAGKVTISTEIMNFLKDWLTKHILGTDKKYTSYLVAKGVK